jgi:PKD repeat protein
MLLATMVIVPAASNPPTLTETIIKVEPALIEFGNSAGDPILIPGTQFTVTVKIYNVTNLYGFDLKFSWNTTFLEYVNRSVCVPRDSYADGVLWDPTLSLADEVNATDGTYWISYASMAPAPSFNGTGTIFTMTFEIIRQPYDYETGGPEVDPIDTVLDFLSTDLAPRVSEGPIVPITHSVEPATVRIWEKRSELSAYPVLKTVPTTVQNLLVNTTFNINVWIVGVDPKYDVESFNMTLNFNSTLIEAASITEGPWLKSYAGNTTETTKQIDNVKGAVTYGLEQVPPITHPPPTSSGTLFTVTFQVAYESLEYPPPSCELTLEPTEILDRNIGPLAHTTENSTYTANRPLPVARFTWSPRSNILLRGQTITFNASESYHPLGGKITQYTWDFADGVEESTADPIITHVYTRSGDLTVVLNVTDYGGFSDYTSTPLHIIEPPPKPHLAVDPPYLKFGPHPPQVVGRQFNVSIYIEDLDAAWSLQNATFTLSYNDTLIDIIGDSANVTIATLWRGPNNVTIFGQPSGIANVTIILNGPSITPSGDQLAATIEFTLLHQGTYPSVDTSLLTLGDIELMGAMEEISAEQPVQGQILIKGISAPLQAIFGYSPLNLKTNESITFDASSSSQNDFNITDYVWNFGDGNITSVRVPVVTHCYSTPQTYNVTLTVTDIDGLNSAVLKTITIEPAVAAVPLDVTPYAIAIVALVIVAAAGIYFIKIRKPRDENKARGKR